MKQEARKAGEDRLYDIAMAARELIAERGFEGLRTRDIAARAGINISTLHYHVPTKEALIALVAQSIRDEFIAQHNARPREGLSPLECLKLEFADFRENLVENPRLFAVFTEVTERAKRDPKIAGNFQPMQRYWHQQLTAILDEGRRIGQFRPNLDPQVASLMVIGTLIGSQRVPDTTVELFDRACDELLRAIINPSQDTGKDK
jgi:AcrR family transcriptional regulator